MGKDRPFGEWKERGKAPGPGNLPRSYGNIILRQRSLLRDLWASTVGQGCLGENKMSGAQTIST